MSSPNDFREPMRVAQGESSCMELDLRDAVAAKNVKDAERHLRDAICRHELVADKMREALTIMAHRQCVLSMIYPKNLGGGHGPDRWPPTPAEHYRRSMLPHPTPIDAGAFPESAEPTDAPLEGVTSVESRAAPQ